MILAECMNMYWGVEPLELIIYANGFSVILILLVFAFKSFQMTIMQKILSSIFLIVFINVLVLGLTLKFPMSYKAGMAYLEKNRIFFDEILSIEEETRILEEFKFGLTCNGNWRIGVGTRGTHVIERGDTLSLFSIIDSDSVSKKSVIRIMEIIDHLGIMSIRGDQYGITFGIKPYGFDSRSEIEYCRTNDCYGKLLRDNFFILNGKPLW